jgi:hypothetical protein
MPVWKKPVLLRVQASKVFQTIYPHEHSLTWEVAQWNGKFLVNWIFGGWLDSTWAALLKRGERDTGSAETHAARVPCDGHHFIQVRI